MKVRVNKFRVMPKGMAGDPVTVVANNIPKVVVRCTDQPHASSWVHLIITDGTAEEVAALKAKGYPIEMIS
ncbi:MAG: hypothetical protein WCT27_05145 [Patescibacteria group bacterium]|jgi:hypothetical protein